VTVVNNLPCQPAPPCPFLPSLPTLPPLSSTHLVRIVRRDVNTATVRQCTSRCSASFLGYQRDTARPALAVDRRAAAPLLLSAGSCCRSISPACRALSSKIYVCVCVCLYLPSPNPGPGGSVAEWLRAGLGRRRARVQIAVATLSGNSLRQTVHTHRDSVHQAAKLVAALLRVAGVNAGLAESNGSLPPDL